MAYTMIDLFAGAGGFTAGFKRHGFTPVLAVEMDRNAAATYAANFGDAHVFCGGIQDFPTDDVPSADVVIGGPPCQGFSYMGDKRQDDPRNGLWAEYFRIVKAAQPAVFVLENVPGFLKSPQYVRLTAEASRLGYTLTAGIVDAVHYGAGQYRKRVMVIGSRVGPIDLPPATHGHGLWLTPVVTVRDRIADLMAVPVSDRLPSRKVAFPWGEAPGVFTAEEIHVKRADSELNRRRYACIPPGGDWKDLPDDLRLPRQTPRNGVLGRYRWDAPSTTIRTELHPGMGTYLHPQWGASGTVNRPITPREGARLQGFPDGHLWCGFRTAIEQQIGNAVPGPLAEAMARQVVERLALG